MEFCPQCGNRSAELFAILPRSNRVVCKTCFVKATGGYPLPAGDGLTPLGYHLGQHVNVPKHGAGAPMPRSAVTIKGVTVRGVTIRDVTIRDVTVKGVTVRNAR